ncbi:5-oxoprolinase subunit PxpB [Lentiprolixibacter aurantiacus]|uniref:5-oxoprolinase subunit PxpB n=1 Tax=Lentiprolixibacter aurantiacus TaxID=2993939 RepID=A0AAE3MMQ1_9FLAO|nr:5-oxoprolinase subunit PxpB [Lentiprolixibacter aurantiacus]
MGAFKINIKPFGERAIIITWPDRVEEAILEDIIDFKEHLINTAFPKGEWELVAAYNSLTVINNLNNVELDKYEDLLIGAYQSKKGSQPATRWLWKLPVCYDLSFGIDLEEVAGRLQMSVKEVVHMHTRQPYLVYGIGFLPGFMYLGGLPKSLEVPRKPTPRLDVQKGSVGLAAKQTGIYPQESPGGWNIIGNCPVPVFNVSKDPPCFISVGDRVQFYEISKAEYDLHQIEAEVGIYRIEKKEWHD